MLKLDLFNSKHGIACEFGEFGWDQDSNNHIILNKEEKIAYCNLTLVCKRWNKDLLGGLY